MWVVLQQGADALGRGRQPLHPAVDRLPRRPGLLPLPAVDGGAHRARALARRRRAVGRARVVARALRRPVGARPRPGGAGGGRHRGARARARHPDPGRPGLDRARARGPPRLVGRARAARARAGGRSCRWRSPARASSTWPCSPRCCSSGAPFGARRTLATGGLAGLLMLPWVVADPAAFVGDTVTTLLEFHPIRFANTWYLYALNEHGVTLPFAVTGAAMVGRRRRRGVCRVAPAARRRRAAALAGPRARRGEPRQQAGVLQPVLARRRPRGRLARGGAARTT